ncbi:ERCC4 domain-containing protein [Arhodomonas sp. SL1]|uniref:ERCC4 domain-containing protein n=1 Tax=Arhodomonas sp. SL1 TaxID=3425691 RepID=UPI003F885ACF
MTTLWRVEAVDDERFPYRITLTQDGEVTLALRAKDRWPGPGGNVFCLREREPPDRDSACELLEEVPVVSVDRLGRRLALTLDRPRRRRCDFLFLVRQYKNRPGEYEQIFFRTQSAARASKSRGRTQLFGDRTLEILIDSGERYPWRFSGANIHREALPSGDYALYEHGQIQAVVERKTFANLLSDIGQIRILHQQLAELASYPHPALVIEAPYGHLLDPKRVAPWPAAHVARAVAEISAMHSALPVIYASNRKQANEWCHGFFRAVSARLADAAPETVAAVRSRHDAGRGVHSSAGSQLAIRREVLEELPARFTMTMLRQRFPDLPVQRLRAALHRLREEGVIRREGHGRGSEWVREA